jgi:hypothetical protein
MWATAPSPRPDDASSASWHSRSTLSLSVLHALARSGHKDNIRITSAVDNITADAAQFRLSSWGPNHLRRGIINSLNLGPGSLDILCGEHMRNIWVNRDAPASVRIDFERPFITPPKVVVFFNYLDLEHSKNFRVFTTATNIESHDFTLNVDKWADTILWGARVGWIAYPQDRDRIFSASVNTKDLRSSDQPELTQSQRIGLLAKGWKAGHAVRDDTLVQKLCQTLKTSLGTPL